MPPVIIAAAVGATATAGSAIAGSIAAGKNRDAAASASQRAVDAINAVGAPPDLAKEIFLKEYQQAGILTPELEQIINEQVQQIKADPAGRNAQMQALQQMTSLSKTGLNAEDRLAQQQVSQQVARENVAQQNSIIQNMQARGQAGGGAELAARLQAAQSGANQLSNSGNQIAANAQARALQALSAAGSMGSQLNSQDFSQAQANTNIVNEANRFNVQNQLAQQQRNVQAQNQAQAANLATKQGVQNANVQQSNAELLRQRAAQQQVYEDTAAHAQAIANANLGQASQQRQAGQDVANTYAGIGTGLGKIISGIGSAYKPSTEKDQIDLTPTKTEELPASNNDYSNVG